ncbi:MAG TPA: RNA polymerase sigma factor [Candidatus Campbellbacteria bacterium]|nr:RNA polymerase sigma factor [Candidatus Campbellbacteria bacterium]
MDQPLQKPAIEDEEILTLSLEKPSAFEVLVDRYQRPFLRTALKIVNHRQEAEDIVQESFTKIYLNARKFKKVDGASFKSWAYKIVINTSISHYKKLKRTMESVEYFEENLYESTRGANIRDIEIEMDIKILVGKILPQMPEHLHGVLRKYYLEDKAQKDIAEEETVSLATIKMRLFRAKKAFRKILDRNQDLCLTV